MRQLVVIVILSLFAYQLATGRIVIRSKRQVEREGNYQNESTVILNGDRGSSAFQEPVTDNQDKEVMEIDFNPDDGSVAFGGRFPSFFNKNFHNGFDTFFRKMTQQFEDMAKNMFQRFNTSNTQYPDNYNGTKEEIITVDGRKYIKKEHVVKKSDNNLNIFLTSTTYEPIEDKNNES